MNLGMYSIEIRRPSVTELFSAITAYGFTQIQFDFMSVCEEQMPASIHPGLVKEIAENAQRHGIEIVAVNGTFNMIHPDVVQRNLGLQRFEVIAKTSNALGCRFLTLCTGSRNPQDMWCFHADNHTQKAWNDMLQSMETILQIAERYDLILGIECEASNTVYSAKKARALLDEFRSHRLKIIMDVANLFQPGQAKRENVKPIIDEAFDLLGNDIYIAHGKDIKEGDGLTFTHAGNGIVDFPYYLKKLMEYGYKGGLLLHGMKDERDFQPSLDFIRHAIAEN